MSDTWDDYAEDWDTNPDAINYSELAFDCLIQATSLEGAEVFDFGCGTGLLTERISPHAKTIVALDTSPRMIEGLKAKNLPNVIPVCKTLTDLLASEKARYQSRFDLVVASSVCAFVPDFGEVLQQIKTILKPDGRLVQWDWLSPEDSSHPGFTDKQMSDAMKMAGFHEICVSKGFTMSGEEGKATVLMAVAIKGRSPS